MKLKDLKDKMSVPLLAVEVVDWEEIISYGEGERAGTIWPINVKDESHIGKVKLFGKQIEQYRESIKPGVKLIITKGWCKIFKEVPEISTSNYGNIDVVQREP